MGEEIILTPKEREELERIGSILMEETKKLPPGTTLLIDLNDDQDWDDLVEASAVLTARELDAAGARKRRESGRV